MWVVCDKSRPHQRGSQIFEFLFHPLTAGAPQIVYRDDDFWDTQKLLKAALRSLEVE